MCSLRYLAFGFTSPLDNKASSSTLLNTIAFCGQFCMQAKQNSQSPCDFTPLVSNDKLSSSEEACRAFFALN